MESSSLALASPRNPRYRTLDMWRGLACLMIVLVHAANGLNLEEARSGQAGGFASALVAFLISRMGVGVTIFFVISGYCIAATADSTRRKPQGYAQYFIRRIRRIFPPYWAILLVSIIVVPAAAALGWSSIFSDGSCRIPHAASLTEAQWLGNFTLTEGWRYHLSGDPNSRLLLFGPAWSLCYEEQFYVICGLILLIAPRRLFGGVAVMTLFTLVMIGWQFPVAPKSFKYFFFDGRWLTFAAGVLVYYLVNYASGRRRQALIGLLVLGMLATAGIRYGLLPRIGDDEQKQRMFEYFVGSSFALLLFLLQPWDGRISRMKILQPINFCGKICYSLYLMHWPVTIVITHGLYQAGIRDVVPTLFLVVPLATGASIAASWLFYLLVERHFINPPATIAAQTEAESQLRTLVPVNESPVAAGAFLVDAQA